MSIVALSAFDQPLIVLIVGDTGYKTHLDFVPQWTPCDLWDTALSLGGPEGHVAKLTTQGYEEIQIE